MKYLLPLLILIFTPSHALDASYDIGSDLVLLETNALEWLRSKEWGDANLDYGYGDDPTDANEPSYGYHGIYWNPKTNEYYYATGEEKHGNLRLTNNLSYEIDSSKQEINYTVSERAYLQYVGSLSFLERLYIAKDGSLYIKILKKIKDPFPVFVDIEREEESQSTYISYTNAAGKKFERNLGRWYPKSDGTLAGDW